MNHEFLYLCYRLAQWRGGPKCFNAPAQRSWKVVKFSSKRRKKWWKYSNAHCHWAAWLSNFLPSSRALHFYSAEPGSYVRDTLDFNHYECGMNSTENFNLCDPTSYSLNKLNHFIWRLPAMCHWQGRLAFREKGAWTFLENILTIPYVLQSLFRLTCTFSYLHSAGTLDYTNRQHLYHCSYISVHTLRLVSDHTVLNE